MPLAYETRKPLAIPDDAWNGDDIATILVQGGRYGGCWAMNAFPIMAGTPGETVIGEIFTNPDDRPDMAVDTAMVWVNDECVRAGLKLAHVKNLNDQYDAESAPYFAAAMFLVDRRA